MRRTGLFSWWCGVVAAAALFPAGALAEDGAEPTATATPASEPGTNPEVAWPSDAAEPSGAVPPVPPPPPMEAFGASKSGAPEAVSDVAAQVTLVTAEEIRAFGYQTLADVLQNVPECFVGGDRTYAIAGLRGVARAGDYNSRILILLDGHVLNEPWNDYAPVGTDLPIDLWQVERIEVITGPVSALYGSNAFYGAVNIVTRQPVAREAGASIGTGSSGWDRAATWFGDGLPEEAASGKTPWNVLAWASATSASGDTLHYPGLAGNPTENGTDWDRSGAGYLRASRGRLSVLATAYSRHRGVPGGAFGSVFGDERNQVQDSRASGDVRAELVRARRVHVRARGYGAVYRYQDELRYDPDPVFVDRATSRWGGAELVLDAWRGPARVVVSLEDSYAVVTQDAFERQGAGTIAPDPSQPPNAVPEDVRSFNLARGSAHATVRLPGQTRVEAGLYGELHEVYGPDLAPRAAIVASPGERTTVKALYGRGFRSPSVFERFYDDGIDLTGNEDLRSETADVVELSLRRSVGWAADAFLSGFHGEYRDLMVRVPVDVDPDPGVEDIRQQYVNRARAQSSGVTAAFQARRGAATLWVDGTALRHRDLDSGAVSGTPEWLAHAMGIVPLDGGRATLALRLSGVGSRPGREGGRLSPYVLGDASVRLHRAWRGLSLLASVTNVFDARYGQPAGDQYLQSVLPAPRRRVFLEARWEWLRAPGVPPS